MSMRVLTDTEVQVCVCVCVYSMPLRCDAGSSTASGLQLPKHEPTECLELLDSPEHKHSQPAKQRPTCQWL